MGGLAFAGYAVTGSICYYATPSGQSGITLTGGGGGGGGPVGAGLLIGPSFSNAHWLLDLHGFFGYAGGTVGDLLPSVGGQVEFGYGSCGQPVGVVTGGWAPSLIPSLVSFEGGLFYTGVFQGW